MGKPQTDRISLKTGMLSFARSLQPSEGLFWGTRSHDPDWSQPIEVFEKGVRGQSSEFKTDNPGKSNPQAVEAAVVPLGCDGAKISFSMRISNFAMKPWACSDKHVTDAYKDLARRYAEKGGFGVLAQRFVWNIANARFAWRNRFQTDQMYVLVRFDAHKLWFDPTRLNLEVPASREQLVAAVMSNDPAVQEQVAKLIGWIEQGLTREPRALDISWGAAMKEGQEIFPSQEYLRTDEMRKDAPSRVYAKMPRHHGGRLIQQASMHSQKIGAALRHIDDWYDHGDKLPIAVNPYAGVQETGEVLRPKSKDGRNFYKLRNNAEDLFASIKAAQGAEDLSGDVHFVIANLVRGGVFGQ